MQMVMFRRKVVLTSDDGFGPNYTKLLSTGLKERGVRATFLLGKQMDRYSETVKEIYDDRHLIEAHSYEHVNLSNLTNVAAIE